MIIKESLVIRELELMDESLFQQALESWDAAPGFQFFIFHDKNQPYADYVTLLKKNFSMGINLPAGFVPVTSLFAFFENEIVGRISIRHELNEHLRTIGGHVGYGVLPKYRGQGIATELLATGIKFCKEKLGIHKVLVTCDETNTASSKVIEKNGSKEIVVVADSGYDCKKLEKYDFIERLGLYYKFKVAPNQQQLYYYFQLRFLFICL